MFFCSFDTFCFPVTVTCAAFFLQVFKSGPLKKWGPVVTGYVLDLVTEWTYQV